MRARLGSVSRRVYPIDRHLFILFRAGQICQLRQANTPGGDFAAPRRVPSASSSTNGRASARSVRMDRFTVTASLCIRAGRGREKSHSIVEIAEKPARHGGACPRRCDRPRGCRRDDDRPIGVNAMTDDLGRPARSIPRAWRVGPGHALLFAAVLAVGVALRFYRITELPAALYPDEAFYGTDTLRSMASGVWRVFYPLNNGHEGLI